MCTSVIVGSKATERQHIIVSRNEDCLRDVWNKYFVYRHQAEYTNDKVIHDGMWQLGNGLKVPKPLHHFGYSAAPDFIANEEAHVLMPARFLFEERGINEMNVAVSATNSFKMNAKLNTLDPLLKEGGITEAVIPTLILPQAESARHGVQLLGHYIEEFGAGEVNGVTIADVNEVWYFENGSSHHWVAVKVPEECYVVVANAMRIHDIDLNSNDVLHSPTLFEFVEKHQLLTAPDKHRFNFAKAFGELGDPYNVDRVWLGQHLFTPSINQPTEQEQYPLFLKADESISVPDVIKVLTATYRNTVLEGIAQRPIGYDKTAESHIITLDKQQPHELQGVIWQAISTPLCSPYIPFFSGVKSFPQTYHFGNNSFENHSAYWAYRILFTLAHQQNLALVSTIAENFRQQEQVFWSEQLMLTPLLKNMCHDNTEQMISFLTRYTEGNCESLIQFAHNMSSNIMNNLAEINKD